MADGSRHDVTGCVLAGGEGRRVGGRDKGLIPYDGHALRPDDTRLWPLAGWVLDALAPQVCGLMVSANRHLDAYADLLGASRTPAAPLPGDVFTDDPDLPPASGPLAGIVSALRRCRTDWLLLAPCDTPHLPADLVERLLSATRTETDVVVPRTTSKGGEIRHHWVCALVRKRVCPQTEALFVKGERKAGLWVRSLNWVSVSFAREVAFTNMNTLETLHGRD